MKLLEYLAPAVNGIAIPPSLGGIPDPAGFGTLVQGVQNLSPLTGYCNFAAINAAANFTFNNATVPGGIPGAWLRASGGAGVNGTLDSTINIVNSFATPNYVGQTAPMVLFNINTGTITMVVGDANTTLSGTTTVLTVNLRAYQIKITNLTPALGKVAANGTRSTPAGAAATNTTTTTAAVAAQIASTTVTSTVIPVTASTGMIANQSVLVVTQSDGSTVAGLVTAINTLNITINQVLDVGALSGATVAVWNPQVTVTGIAAFGTTGAIA